MKQVFTGPFSPLPRRIWAAEHAEGRRHGEQGGQLWILPSRELLQEVRQELLKHRPGLVGVEILTFDEIAWRLATGGRKGERLLPPLYRELLMEKVIATLKERLVAFAPVSDTPGFLRGVLAAIGELKRAHLSPREVLQKAQQASNRKLEELAWLYEAYQQSLQGDPQWLEPEDVLALGAQVLSRSDNHAFAHIHSIRLDHFTDFPPLQRELLKGLLQLPRLRQVKLYIPYQPQEWKQVPQVLQGTEELLSWLREHGFEHQHLESEAAIWQVMAGVEPPADMAFPPKQRALPAAGVQQEVQGVLRRIKRLVAEEQVPLNEVCVVLPASEAYRQHLHQAAEELGIPLAIPHEVPLLKLPFISRLLALMGSTLPEAEAVPLSQPLLTPYVQWLEQVPSSVLRLGRQLSLTTPLGKAIHLLRQEQESMEQRAQEEAGHEAVAEKMAVAEALNWLQAVEERLAALPDRGTAPALCQAAREFLLRAGIPVRLAREVREGQDLGAGIRDLKAFHLLLGSLEELEQVLVRSLGDGQTLSYSRWYASWMRLLEGYAVEISPASAGGLEVLRASALRGLKREQVFVLGCNEGTFPATVRENWLLTDAERKLLHSGVHLQASAYRMELEQLFLYMAQSAARGGITYSYVSPRFQEEAVISPFLEGLKLPLVEEAEEAGLSYPVIPPQRWCSWLEAEDSLVQLAAQGKEAADWGRQLFPHFSLWLKKAEVERARRSGAIQTDWAAWDGILADGRTREQLALRFDQRHLYSASQLNSYATCPYKFFAERVLQLRELRQRERRLLPAQRGDLAHEVLRRWYSKWQKGQGASQRLEAFDRSFEEVCAEFEAGISPRMALFWPWEKERLYQSLRRWVEHQVEQEPHQWQPVGLEVSFGLAPDERSDPHSLEQPIPIRVGEQELMFYGRIDRVDVNPQGDFVIYDYKWSVSRYRGIRDVQDGLHYQLPLYLQAAAYWLKQRGWDNPRPVGAGFVGLDSPGAIKGIWLKEEASSLGLSARSSGLVEDLEQLTADALAQLEEQWQALRSGLFPPSPKVQCDPFCPYTAVCRIATKQKVAAEDEST